MTTVYGEKKPLPSMSKIYSSPLHTGETEISRDTEPGVSGSPRREKQAPVLPVSIPFFPDSLSDGKLPLIASLDLCEMPKPVPMIYF